MREDHVNFDVGQKRPSDPNSDGPCFFGTTAIDVAAHMRARSCKEECEVKKVMNNDRKLKRASCHLDDSQIEEGR